MSNVINLLVEGDLDEAVGRRLVLHHGAEPGVTYGKQGFGYIKEKVQAFARSSAGVPLIAIVDLMDTGSACAAEVVDGWLSFRPSTMLFRIAVREIESWVLADRASIARHLSVPISRVPSFPDEIDDPKNLVISLARRSRARTIRDGIVPTADGASTGPLYNSIMVGFVQTEWSPVVAAENSPSLARATRALVGLTGTS